MAMLRKKPSFNFVYFAQPDVTFHRSMYNFGLHWGHSGFIKCEPKYGKEVMSEKTREVKKIQDTMYTQTIYEYF